MCELFALSASAPVDIKLSLGELARHGDETGIHADGWGVAFLEGRDARVFREPQAAALSPWVKCLQDHPVRSDTAIAHIRHATLGAISLANTQPFGREWRGRAHVFAHNGHLGDFALRDWAACESFMPIGEMDSEAAFCRLMHAFSSSPAADAVDQPCAMLATFTSFARQMRDLGPANCILATNGLLLVHADRRTQRPGVIEPPGLWILQRSCHADEPERLIGAGIDVSHSALQVTLVASVPLTQEGWQPLERGRTLAIGRGQVVGSSFV